MRRLIAIFLFLSSTAVAAEEPRLLSHWVQLGAHGFAEARVVVEADRCPAIVIDGKDHAMHERAAPEENFQNRICAALLPRAAASVSVLGSALALPKYAPERIVVLGDTGCRMKGETVQACNDPRAWPFASVAAAAAKLKPDLVIHVGDYHYRETPCPPGNAGCAGSPYGDNWQTWNADFFAPASPLLATAAWVLVRGNHEDCRRAGAGWSRLMAATRETSCRPYEPPYVLPLDGLNLVVMDDTDAPDTEVKADSAAILAREIAELPRLAPSPIWLLQHRPIWAAISGPLGIPIGGNATIIDGIGTAGIPDAVTLMLSGHIHAFQALNYTARKPARVPPQIVAGHGGDKLDETPANLAGAIFQGRSGVKVKDGLSVAGFGFLLMTREGIDWRLDLHDMDGNAFRQCRFAGGRIDCPKTVTKNQPQQ